MSTTVDVPRIVATNALVRRAERLSPAFVRVWLESPDFIDMAPDEGFDTRFKIVFPGPTGALPPLPVDSSDWYPAWLAMPAEARAPMRTYTIRDVTYDDSRNALLVVDFVVHEPWESAGPACRWAMTACRGDQVQVAVPRRQAIESGGTYGGAEFNPGTRRDILIAADETAVPAVARILSDIGTGYRGSAFLEVPAAADTMELDNPSGIDITWIAREGAQYGRPLVDRVRDHLGLDSAGTATTGPVNQPAADIASSETVGDIDIWETPRYSAAGEDIRQHMGPERDDVYAWIAGESWAVKQLRRALVRDCHIERHQVAFMGYWRDGVAMKS